MARPGAPDAALRRALAEQFCRALRSKTAEGSVPVAVVTADASGTIAFSNAPGTTRPVTYSVAPVGSLVDPPIISLPPHDNHGHATATETATISKEQQRRGA